MKIPTEITRYNNDKVLGDASNSYQPVRFDDTDGYIGITQFEGPVPGARVKERVLLTPVQMRALIRFVKECR